MLYLVVGVMISLAVALFLYGVGRALEPVAEVDDRITALIRDYRASEADENAESGGLMARIDRGIARQGFASQTATELARADLALTVTEYVLLRAGLVVGGVILGYLLQRTLVTAAAVGLAAFFLPVLYVRSRQGRRRRAFDAQLPDVLDHLVGSLRAGYGLLQAVEWVARQIPPPAGEEFDRVVREVQLGRPLTDALDSTVRRIASDDLALIVTAIKIHHEVGGGLAEILATVAETIRQRVRIQREIQVLTAQQRYSGYVLMIMPIALGFLLFLMNPSYESQLFAPGPTLCIPIVTAFMMVIGFFVMRRIVEIEV
jgi:tight adherence protein B